MKKMIGLGLMVLVVLSLSLPGYMCPRAMAEDSKEVVTLKLEKALEAQARIRAELQLMQYRFKEWQEALTIIDKEVKDFQGKLKAMEPKKEELKKEPTKEKK